MIAAGMAWWNIDSGRKDSENRLISEAARAAGEISHLLALPTIEIDERTARATSQGAMEDERLYAVKITSGKEMLYGQRRNYMWEPVPWDDEIAEASIQGMNPIRIDGQNVGRVEVWLSQRVSMEENSLLARREIWRFVIFAIIWTAAFVFWGWNDARKIGTGLRSPAERRKAEKIILGSNREEVTEKILPIVDANYGRKYQCQNDNAWLVTAGMFRQTFTRAPELLSRLYAEGETAGICHLGRMLEQAAPCVGAMALEKAAKEMQAALNDPECKAKALPVEKCVAALEDVLDALCGKG